MDVFANVEGYQAPENRQSSRQKARELVLELIMRIVLEMCGSVKESKPRGGFDVRVEAVAVVGMIQQEFYQPL